MKGKTHDISISSLKGNGFRFLCHKGIECFNRCCRQLNLVLTPYDIMRLKNRLNISSGIFLENYTETRFNDSNRFPLIYLKMLDGKDRRCPFVEIEGCTIYEDRPGACRMYPLGRAAARPEGKRDTVEKFFMIEEKHCLGFHEDREWTLEEWLENQGLDDYNMFNDLWMEIITSSKDLGQGEDFKKKVQMFNMASYNLDRFREFLFGSRFFTLFDVEPDIQDELASDDTELIIFAFKWLKFSLFGEDTIQIKS